MSHINIFIAAGCLLFLIIFLVYRIFAVRKKNPIITNESDPSSPQSFGISNKNQDNKKLTMQEKIELSWQFLYDITDTMINKFSKEDVILVNKCGHVLFDHGAKYDHIVDLALTKTKSPQSVEQEQSKGKKTLGV